MLHGKFNLFLSPCQKSRHFESICNVQPIWQFGHILPVFGAYLEFSSSFPLVISASLKHIIDNIIESLLSGDFSQYNFTVLGSVD